MTTAEPPVLVAPSPPLSPPRWLGRVDGARPGPTVVLLGGIHGNEPAGARAAARVLAAVEAGATRLRGSVLGLAGNLGALAAGRRFLARDLNRGWLSEPLRALLARPQGSTVLEDAEQRDLLAQIAPVLAAAREPVWFLDLHSTSGTGAPFVCMADVLRNRPMAFALPVPVILGIEETLDGTLLGYLSDLGHVAVAVEGGQHADPLTQRHHEAAIWQALVTAGSLDAADVPGLAGHRQALARAAHGLPRVVEIRHRHVVARGDGFVMGPGFANFTPVERGQIVASDRDGPIRSPEAGLMLMPRYQGQGDDGFFLARPVSRRWLTLSALLRRARLDRLVPWLPGVARHPSAEDHYVADPRIARWQVVNVFHLFGYRHVRASAAGWVFSRRRPAQAGLRPLPDELRALLA